MVCICIFPTRWGVYSISRIVWAQFGHHGAVGLDDGRISGGHTLSFRLGILVAFLVLALQRSLSFPFITMIPRGFGTGLGILAVFLLVCEPTHGGMHRLRTHIGGPDVRLIAYHNILCLHISARFPFPAPRDIRCMYVLLMYGLCTCRSPALRLQPRPPFTNDERKAGTRS